MDYDITFTKHARSSRRLVNQEVRITSVYFQPGRRLKSFPKRMEFEGREYTFLESGLRYLIQRGQRLVEVFDMTDGNKLFRLTHDTLVADTAADWTLVGIRDSHYAAA